MASTSDGGTTREAVRSWVQVVAWLLLAALVVPTTVTPYAADAAQRAERYEICHRTNSVSNPYRRINVSWGGTQGHLGHTGPVFDVTDPGRYKSQGVKWGDIFRAQRGGAVRQSNWTTGSGGNQQPIVAAQAIFGVGGAAPATYVLGGEVRVACRAMGVVEFIVSEVEAGTPMPDIMADLDDQGAAEDVAVRAALGRSFSAWYADPTTPKDLAGLTAALGEVEPTLHTEPAAAVTTTTAVLRGLVDPNGTVIALRFELERVDGVGGRRELTASMTVGGQVSTTATGTAPVAVSLTAGELSPSTSYRARLVGLVAAGSGDDALDTELVGEWHGFLTRASDDPGPDPGDAGDDPGTGDPGDDPGPGDPGDDPGTGDPGDDPGTGDPGDDPGPGDPGDDPGAGGPGDEPDLEDPIEDPAPGGGPDPGGPTDGPGPGDPGDDPGADRPSGPGDGPGAGPDPGPGGDDRPSTEPRPGGDEPPRPRPGPRPSPSPSPSPAPGARPVAPAPSPSPAPGPRSSTVVAPRARDAAAPSSAAGARPAAGRPTLAAPSAAAPRVEGRAPMTALGRAAGEVAGEVEVVERAARPATRRSSQPRRSEQAPEQRVESATTSVERRTVDALAQEAIGGFSPNSSVRIEVEGARTAGRFVLPSVGALDPAVVLAALRRSIEEDAADFARIDRVTILEEWSGDGWPRSDAERAERFATLGLAGPRRVDEFDIGTGTSLLVEASVDGYAPGTVVALVVTTSPIVLAEAVVGRDGTATVRGPLPLATLDPGGHRLRVVGTRTLDGVSVDAAGEVVLSERTLQEIRRFDGGTQAVVTVSGEGEDGQAATAVRIVPLGTAWPWWTLAVVALVGLCAVSARRRGRLSGRRRLTTAVAAVLVSAAPAVVLGFAVAAWPVMGLGVLGALVLAMTLVAVRPRHHLADEPDGEADGDRERQPVPLGA